MPAAPAPLPTAADVTATAQLLAGRVVRTPLIASAVLDDRVGGRVLIKVEPFQRTGSFKFRGAMSRLLRLSEAERAAGVVAWSSGNHGQAVAAAGRLLGVPAVIVMPADAPRVKLERTRSHGAEVVLYDRAREDREAIARDLARDRCLTVVPSFDDRWVIAGQGSAAVEILEQAQDLGGVPDDLLVCCGGGGLTAGCALALEAAGAATRLWTVEPEHWDDHARSFAAGERLTASQAAPTACDALMTPTPGEITFAINQPRVAGGLAVSEAQVEDAMRFAFEELRCVVEPGGAVALAAVLAGVHRGAGRTTALLLTGGNVDADAFAAVITARRSR